MAATQSARTAPAAASARTATGLASAALVVAIASVAMQFARGSDPAPPARQDAASTASQTTAATLEQLRSLATRVQRLESSRASTAGATPAESTSERPSPGDRQEVLAADQRALRELATRVAQLEQARTEARKQAQGLAAPDAIPATLAVLLASRGVITKPGDIEAIQANMDTLGQLVADPTARDWDRIEAYRGMLTFGFESPDACIAAMPHLASMLLTCSDAKARTSAAGLLQTYKNPAIASTLMAAYSREENAEVRAAIIGSMLQLAADPGIRQTLATAAKREQDEALRKRIRRTLDK